MPKPLKFYNKKKPFYSQSDTYNLKFVFELKRACLSLFSINAVRISATNKKMDFNVSFWTGLGCGICLGFSLYALKKYFGTLPDSAKAVKKVHDSVSCLQ